MNARLERAQGCLLGQLAGDALGSLVEFMTPDLIRKKYPNKVCDMADGGAWDTIAGQPTDDSEMALLLARMLVKHKIYNPNLARNEYVYWINLGPFDCGMTIAAGLRGRPNPDSQANGALMRISPLGIFGAGLPLPDVSEWAMQDARITHPHPVCQQINALYTAAIAQAIHLGVSARELYEAVLFWADEMAVEPAVMAVVKKAEQFQPDDYVHQQGWVLIAFQNALWQLLHAESMEEGVVMQGGDTDTNAAICGALLGAVNGIKAVPGRWLKSVIQCKPSPENPSAKRPRPECFWPVDAMQLAESLLTQK